MAVTFISGLQTPINFSLISCSSATSSVNILCFTQVETGKWNVLKVVLSPLPCKTSSGDQNVIHWGLQSTLQFPPRLSCVCTTFKLFDVIFYFSETLTQLIKPMQWGVPDPLYANRITRRTERWEKKAQSSDFLEVRYITIWWTKVNLNRVMEAPNMAYHNESQ